MRLEVLSPDGVGEVVAGDDLAALLLAALAREGEALHDGDVVVVTSKVVSKAEGRVVRGDREAGIAEETVRVVARRGPTTIVRTRHGLTMAAAGVDASNVAVGHVVLLPLDPDASARRLRAALRAATGAVVGVVVTDTAGRAWRTGQTDMAIGAAGVVVLDDHGGRTDPYGNPLVVTAPAVADEVASAAELAGGKLVARPFAVVRGRPDLVLGADEDGPGATALVREDGADLFGYGSREAVVRALAPDTAGHDAARTPFGAAAPAPELADALHRVGLEVVGTVPDAAAELAVPLGAEADAARVRLRAVATAYGWDVKQDGGQDGGGTVRLRPRTDGPYTRPRPVET